MIRVAIFVLALIPFLALVYGAFTENLGTNPVETMTHETGEWALRFLLITLAITPLRKWLGKPAFVKYRRMLGLYAFFYACLHLLTYVWFDQYFDVQEIIADIIKRPFITVGFAAFLLLIPLALTSTKAMQRRLKKNWVKLHKLVYVIPVLALIHFVWLLKADYIEPIVYGVVFVGLMLARVKKKSTS